MLSFTIESYAMVGWLKTCLAAWIRYGDARHYQVLEGHVALDDTVRVRPGQSESSRCNRIFISKDILLGLICHRYSPPWSLVYSFLARYR